MPTGRFALPLHWAPDSRSLYAVVEKPSAQSPREPYLARIFVETGDPILLMSLVGDALRKATPVRNIVIGFDHDAERCFFSVDLEGRQHDMVWSIPRSALTHKRFHPLDFSEPVGTLAVSPDGRLVAVRFGTADALTPPAVYDAETEKTSLIVADDESRKTWLSELAKVARRLLLAGLPAGGADSNVGRGPRSCPSPESSLLMDWPIALASWHSAARRCFRSTPTPTLTPTIKR